MAKPPQQLTPNPTVAINPSEASLAELATVDHAGPIAMLNMLRFDGDAGRALYGQYARVAVETIAAFGGALMYHGRVNEPTTWDSIAIVYYPSIDAYLTMQNNPSYIKAIPNRTSALTARLLCPFALPPTTESERVNLIASYQRGAFEVALVRWNDATTALDGRSESDLIDNLPFRSVGRGLVTDQSWDELHLVPLGNSYPGSFPEVGAEVAAMEIIVSEPVQ